MSVYRKKVFPLRLPENYHGSQRQANKLGQTYKQKSFHKQANPQLNNPKIVNWQIKRNNKFVTEQRREYLTHTGKISHDTPFWFQTTTNFYRREEAMSLRKNQKAATKQERNFDVFNRKRFSFTDSLDNAKTEQRFSSKRSFLMDKNCSWNVTHKIGELNKQRQEIAAGSTLSGFFRRDDVTAKIGSVESRDYSVKKPQLKIGKTECINTYSPF